MAYDVLVRFTVNADSDDRAHAIVENLLAARLDPTSTEFQPEPHAVIDSWSLWPEDELGAMLMLGPVSDGNTPRFIPLARLCEAIDWPRNMKRPSSRAHSG